MEDTASKEREKLSGLLILNNQHLMTDKLNNLSKASKNCLVNGAKETYMCILID